MESPALTALDPRQQTVFRAAVAAVTVEFRKAPFDMDRRKWTDPDRYESDASVRPGRALGRGRDHPLPVGPGARTGRLRLSPPVRRVRRESAARNPDMVAVRR